MNKRITSLLLVFSLILSMLATAVPAFAAPPTCTYSIEADKTSANPGDTINFTVYMKQTGNQNTMQGELSIPSGLTYVSGALVTGIKDTLGWDNAEWTPSTMMLTGYGSESYTGTEKLAILNFQCKVNDDAESKDYTVKLIDVEADDENYETKNPTSVPVTITVTIPHVHVYDQTSTDSVHLKSAATCTSPAVYYKSCTCGENGSETFTSGSALGHDYTEKIEDSAHLKTAAAKCTEYNVYWYDCSRCDSNAKNDAEATDKYYTSTTAGSHSFTQMIEDSAHYVAGTGANCLSVKKYYYDCAYCDQIGTNTWDSTTYGEHEYDPNWSSNSEKHWHECVNCGDQIDGEEHTPGPAATETTPQKCTKCDYIINPPIVHVHSMTPVAANPANCTSNGNRAYYVCSGCSKWYEDATGSVEITDHSSVVITRLGHNYTQKLEDADHLKTAATKCTEHNIYWYDCSRCDSNAKNDPDATDKYFTSATTGSHSFTEKIQDTAHRVAGTGVNCQSYYKYYYDCAYCNQIGTNTWESTAHGPHNYSDEYKSNATEHWRECSICSSRSDDVGPHTPDRAAPTETEPVKCTTCHYVMQAALGVKTPVTSITATITAPKLGEEPDTSIDYTVNPTGSIKINEVSWVKIAEEQFTGTDTDVWKNMTAGEKFTTGYYYSVDIYFGTKEGFKITDSTTATLNGMAHDDTYGGVHDLDDQAYLCGTFAPLHAHVEGTEWKYDSNNHWHICTVAGCGEVIESSKAAHTPDRAAPTETDPVKCTECGYIIANKLGSVGVGHSHSITKVPAKAPTCTEDGNIEYYRCNGCDKLFADATGSVEITADKTVVKATGHKFKWVIDKEPTETEDGYKHEECTVCGFRRNENTVIPATGDVKSEDDSNGEDVEADTSEKSPATGSGYEALALFAVILASGAGISAVGYGRKRKENVE